MNILISNDDGINSKALHVLAKNENSDQISFEEFCSIFAKIYEKSDGHPEKAFLEGFCYMDKDK
mgnify:CR=1 FL=1